MLVTLRGQTEIHPFFTRHLIISLPLTETTLTRGLRKITFPYIFKTYTRNHVIIPASVAMSDNKQRN